MDLKHCVFKVYSKMIGFTYIMKLSVNIHHLIDQKLKKEKKIFLDENS